MDIESHLDIWPASYELMCLRLNIKVHSHRGLARAERRTVRDGSNEVQGKAILVAQGLKSIKS